MSISISREKYAMMYGPTVGDKVRLADTSLVIEVEDDFTHYGDESKFGGGKALRDGMGQSVLTTSESGDLDLVIKNSLSFPIAIFEIITVNFRNSYANFSRCMHKFPIFKVNPNMIVSFCFKEN